MSIIYGIVSIFAAIGSFVIGVCILGAATAASAWCVAFLGSVIAVGRGGREVDGINVGVPVGGVLGFLLTLWAIFTVGMWSSIIVAIGFCAFVLFCTALAFLFCPPRPLPFGDDGLC